MSRFGSVNDKIKTDYPATGTKVRVGEFSSQWYWTQGRTSASP